MQNPSTSTAVGKGMTLPGCRISGLGYYVPDEEVTSTDLEQRFGISAGRVEKLTGIRARRYFRDGQPSELAVRAAVPCLQNAGISANDLDGIIYTGLSRDFEEPGTANIIQDRLDARKAQYCFDIPGACLGFLFGVFVARNTILAGEGERILVVAAEGGWDVEKIWWENRDEYSTKDLFTLLTLGHGAAAAVVERANAGAAGRLVSIKFQAFGELWNLCKWKGPGHLVLTQMAEIQKAGVDALVPHVERCLSRAAWSKADLDVLVPHQPARQAVEGGKVALGTERTKIITTYKDWGNTISVCLPATFAKAVEEGDIKSGDRVALAGAGSGLNVGVALIEW